MVQCEPLQVGLTQFSDLDKTNISHGNKNKGCILLGSNNSKTFPQKAGAVINKEEIKSFYFSFLFASCQPE